MVPPEALSSTGSSLSIPPLALGRPLSFIPPLSHRNVHVLASSHAHARGRGRRERCRRLSARERQRGTAGTARGRRPRRRRRRRRYESGMDERGRDEVSLGAERVVENVGGLGLRRGKALGQLERRRGGQESRGRRGRTDCTCAGSAGVTFESPMLNQSRPLRTKAVLRRGGRRRGQCALSRRARGGSEERRRTSARCSSCRSGS